MKRLFLALLTVIAFTDVYSQYIPSYIQNNSFITDNCEILDNSGWLLYKDESEVVSENFWSNYKSYFGLGADDNMILFSNKSDNYPFSTVDNILTHKKYQHYYKGVKVEGSEYIIHSNGDDKIIYANGKIAEGLDMSVTPTISANQAITDAINYIGSVKIFSWMNADMELSIKDESSNPNATYYPSPELVICYTGEGKDYSNTFFYLAYKLRILCLTDNKDCTYYIDAYTGNVIKSVDEVCASFGTAHTTKYGDRQIDAFNRSAPYWDFILKWSANNLNIYTKDANATDHINSNWLTMGHGPNGKDGHNDWQLSKSDVTTCHWATSETWNYFKNNFNRSGIDNANSQIKVIANANDNATRWARNAVGSDRIAFGFVNGIALSTVDLVGHEYTHGITKIVADLGTSNESGALNESFSDIFGIMVEKQAEGQINDWLLGEDAFTIRDLGNPNGFVPGSLISGINTSMPSTYQGNGWFFGTDDNGGIHHNCSVQNYWFYLLSKGSTGALSGTYNSISVTSIGEEKAAQIAFYNLENNMQTNSQYIDARTGSLLAAIAIFGKCSQEYRQTKNAWAAVGIGAPFKPLNITGPLTVYLSIIQNQTVVLGGLPKTYTASGDWAPYAWLYSGPMTYNISGASNENFNVTNFNYNNNYLTQTIQANSQCGSVSKNIVFLNLGFINLSINTGPDKVNLYPNPAKTAIFFTADFTNQIESDPWVVSIMSNSTGSIIFQNVYPTNLPESINVSNFANGYYTLYIQKGSHSQGIRFIKE